MKQFLFLGIILLFSMQVSAQAVADTSFVNLAGLSGEFRLEMKYATSDNFLKTAVYDCPDCYLRSKAAKALVQANEAFLKLGYRIRIFDCYRPLDVQKRMWALVPDPSYVADPSKGSLHNRGLAVDITLEDASGVELEMGTGFDHFGPESAYRYKGISREARKNRRLLARIMEDHGFAVLASEWWHFNFVSDEKPAVSNFKWNCDQGMTQER